MALQTYTLIETFIANETNQQLSTYAGVPFTFAQGSNITADDANTNGADVVNPAGEFIIPWEYLSQLNPNPAPNPPAPTPNPPAPTPNNQPTATAKATNDIFLIVGISVAVIALIYTFSHSPVKATA